jgi:3-oxoadipate enol-lactonase
MLAHRVLGDGMPLVFLHAYPLSGDMWDSELAYFSKQFKTLIVDLPGFGRSARQNTPSIPQMAVEVQALLKHLSINGPVFIGGLSMGGYVAFEFVRQFPDQVKALGLFSTRSKNDTPEAREGRYRNERVIRQKGLEGLVEQVTVKLLGKTTGYGNPAVKERVSKMILNNDKEGVADSLWAMAQRQDSSGILPSIQVPTLILAGDEDSFVPMDEARQMQKKIPNARLEIITEAGHLINLEQPARFQALVEEFLRTCLI